MERRLVQKMLGKHEIFYEKIVASTPAYNYAPPPTLGRINNEFSLAVAHAEYARAGILEAGRT
jgi:hypothetical protein